MLQLVIAVLTFVSGSGVGTQLPDGPVLVPIAVPEAESNGEVVAMELLSLSAGEPHNDQSPLADVTPLAASAAQVDPDEPLDAPLDQDEETLDAPIEQVDVADAEEPLDAPLDEEVLDVPLDEEVLDAPVEEVEVLDAPLDDTIAVQPPEAIEPLDAPTQTDIVDQPAPDVVALAPVKKPVAVPVAVSTKPKAAPLPEGGKLVTSLRKKDHLPAGAPGSRVVVTAGRSTIPVEYAGCDVAAAAGRATVGSDCDDAPAMAEHQPAIPRSPGSTALISTDNPSRITSRRDGIQIGDYPEPTLGDSIATSVRAAIAPEDVVVPEVLIVPGELTVAGNDAREDPIVLWRSELEEASAETGMPVEVLATAIRATSNGEVDGRSEDGVGLMFVPVEELVARGIAEEDWFDPGTNIRIGAQIMAERAASSDAPTQAALTNYLAATCGAGDACAQPESPHVAAWIVHYRLRMAHGVSNTPDTATESVLPDDWPFSEPEPEPAASPFDRPGWPFDEDVAENDGPMIPGRDQDDGDD